MSVAGVSTISKWKKAMRVFGRSLASRLQAAKRAFRHPTLVQRGETPHYGPEPPVVLGNLLLAGKNVLVTGVGKNIGKSIVVEMASQGANVYCTCLEERMCRALEEETSQMYPGKIQWFQSDLTSQADNDRLIAYFQDRKIRVHVYINNGFSESEDVLQAFQTNFFGPLYIARRIAGGMISDGIAGSILFLTSIHQEKVRRILGYSSSKAALKMAIEELAVEFGPYNIRVNGIAPGSVGEDEIGRPLPHWPTALAGTSINPRYIGRAAVYLSSDYFSRFTTGTVLRIDGGLSLFNHLCLDFRNAR